MDRNSSDSDLAILQDLLTQGLLLPGGVPGIFGRGEAMNDLLDRLAARVTLLGRTLETEVMRFPPVISRQTVEHCGYLHSFPHLLGTVHTFRGDQDQHALLVQEVERGADWGRFQTLSDVLLTPAACYAVYPQMTGTLPVGGRYVDVESWCFRHEPSQAPQRMRSFRMREFVRIGDEAAVRAWRDDWMECGKAFLRAIGLDVALAPATDPFFGTGARLLTASQREQQLKFELLAPIGRGSPPTALMSCNYHLAHFGERFAVRTSDGNTAHTACVAFGMERIALAFLAAHGADPDCWPASVRASLA